MKRNAIRYYKASLAGSLLSMPLALEAKNEINRINMKEDDPTPTKGGPNPSNEVAS